jgi:hypothetical protein
MLTKRERLSKWLRRAALSVRAFDESARSLFIFGSQRSGTNMTMRVINNCPETECYWENDEEAFHNYRLKKLDIVDSLIASSRAKVVAFKPITESQHAGDILDRYPIGRGLWVYRDYNDVVNSALRNFSEHRKYLFYMLHEPDVADWRLENVPGSTLTLIRRLYDCGISDASAQALIWWVRNQHFFLQELESREDFLLVKYEEMVRDPAAAVGEIFQFTDLRFDPRFTRSISHTSVTKHEPPTIDPAIRDLCDTMLEDLDRVRS